jgi:hypothetical protein
MESLEEFLRELKKVLEDAALRGDGLVPVYLQTLLKEAWVEVGRHYIDVERAVMSGEYEHELAARGLRGPEFRVKSEGFRRHLWLFRRQRQPRWLKKLLEWADIILGSLASIIPGGDAVKEFKEAVEAGAEEMDDGSAEHTEKVPPRG